VFDHVTVRVSDQRASRRFHETVLTPLGYRISVSGENPKGLSTRIPLDVHGDR
jgi:hypothetical protein